MLTQKNKVKYGSIINIRNLKSSFIKSNISTFSDIFQQFSLLPLKHALNKIAVPVGSGPSLIPIIALWER